MALTRIVFLFLVWMVPVRPLTVSQSIPFAPFRMECSKGHGLVELSIRLVTSAGGNRQDVLYTCACENLNVMFPVDDDLKPLVALCFIPEYCRDRL